MGHTGNVRELVSAFKAADEREFAALVGQYASDPRAGVQKAIEQARRRLAAEKSERERTEVMYSLQQGFGSSSIVVGIDEVGRGAVAGPLTVAAVVLPLQPRILELNDSKQLTPSKREELAERIKAAALAYSVVHIEPSDIDACGMSASLRVAMSRALSGLHVEPDHVLIDGNPIHIHPREQCIVKGDAKVACIAAASIIAKVTRDALMVEMDSVYPGYHFAESKGYASAEHIAAIKKQGLSDIHRASFCQNFLEEPAQGTLF